jgi:hypothetical protein
MIRAEEKSMFSIINSSEKKRAIMSVKGKGHPRRGHENPEGE